MLDTTMMQRNPTCFTCYTSSITAGLVGRVVEIIIPTSLWLFSNINIMPHLCKIT